MGGPDDLKAYLAQKYLSPAPGSSQPAAKKKKKKQATAGSLPAHATTVVVDDDAETDAVWAKPQPRPAQRRHMHGSAAHTEQDGDIDAVVVADVGGASDSQASQLRFKDKSGWVTLREGSQREADDASEKDGKDVRMDSGTGAGLKTGAALLEYDERRRAAEAARKASAAGGPDLGRDAATVHRDRFGRRIDPAAQAAAEQAAAQTEAAAESERRMWVGGIAQAAQAVAAARRLEAERDAPLAVHADDADRNQELKARARWGDPMALMAASSGSGSAPNAGRSKQRQRALYRGPPPPPNRFGILPGYRWDGVDRSNGFEAKFFQQQHSAAILKTEAHRWSTEDM